MCHAHRNLGDAIRARAARVDWAGDAEQEFLAQLERCLRDRRDYEVPTCILGVKFPEGKSPGSSVRRLLEARRGLDVTLVTRDETGRPHVTLLLPQTDEGGMTACLRRLEELPGLDAIEGIPLELSGQESAREVLDRQWKLAGLGSSFPARSRVVSIEAFEDERAERDAAVERDPSPELVVEAV